jgi:hypothetical protein
MPADYSLHIASRQIGTYRSLTCVFAIEVSLSLVGNEEPVAKEGISVSGSKRK